MQDLSVFPSNFGELLKAARQRKRLTQQQLAQRLGVHANTISAWELGTYLPANRGIVLELARHLSLDVPAARQLLEASLNTLFTHWRVPFPRNPFFTGRERILEKLHAWLGTNQASASTWPCALHGLGGVGKTQIALEYTYRYALDYQAVFWIGAETSESIVASLLYVASVLQLPGRDDKDQQQVVAAVQHWLGAHSQWLLIWDNVEDLDLLNRFLPATRQGAILITTRCQSLGTLARGIDLLPMEQEEGMLLLLRRANVLELEATEEQVRQFAARLPAHYTVAADLVTAMGGLPLALDQAGAYLEATQCGLPVYLDLFRTRRAVLLKLRGEGVLDHQESAFTTLRLSITVVTERHPAVWDLLRVCALLQPEAIPEELFRQGAKHLGTTLAAVCCDELEWNQVVAVACSSSLLHRQPEEQTLSLHRLVQAVLLDAMTEIERAQWNRLAIEALDALFPEILPSTTSATWKLCERLLPHVLACLHREGTTDETLVAASLASKSAQYLRECGRYAEAEALSLRSLQIREQVLGTDHPDVAASLNALAAIYWRQGKYTEAEPLWQRALHIWEQALGPEHPEVARALNNLARLALDQGKYEEAEPLLRRASRLLEDTLGPEHPFVMAVLHNLAGLYQDQGNYKEAEPLRERTLSIRERVLGPEHPEVAYSLRSLAELYIEQGRYEEAEALSQRALHIWEQAVEPDHPIMAYSLTSRAIVSLKQGKHEQAESCFQHALRLWERRGLPEHPDMALTLNGLAELYAEQGKDEEAEQLYRRAAHISECSLGLDHPQVAHSLNGLAHLCQVQSKDAEAECLFQRALSIREHHLGPYHPELAQTLHDLALFHSQQGCLDEGLSCAERALAIRLQSLGEVHPKTIATHTLYAQLVREQAAGAEPTLEHLRTLLKVRGWSVHLKKRRGKPYVYATRKAGQHTHSRYLAPLSNLSACLAAASTLPNAKEE